MLRLTLTRLIVAIDSLKKDGGTCQIIVKFTSYCAKAKLTSNRRKLATINADKLFPSLNWPLRPAGWSKDRPFVHRTFINDNLTKAGSRHQSTLSEESRQDQGCVVGWGDRISVCVKCNDKILSVTNIKDLSVFNA